MLLPYHKCRNSTITALWTTHFTLSLSGFSISIQNTISHSVRAEESCASECFTEGNFSCVSRLSCKSFGTEHLHLCSGPWLCQSLFQTASCSVIKRTTEYRAGSPYIFAWHELGAGPSPRKEVKSTKSSNNFKMLWDSSAKHITNEHYRDW